MRSFSSAGWIIASVFIASCAPSLEELEDEAMCTVLSEAVRCSALA